MIPLFRLLLRCYPRTFRETYAQDMEMLFAEKLAARRRGRALFLARTAANLIVTGAAERWHSRQPSATRGKTTMGLLQDARYAFRLLRRQPAFSLFVILTLAIGIGANAAVFSVVDGVLLKPLPYAESDRLVAIWGRFDPESGFDFPQFVLSNPEYLDYRDHSKAVSEMAALQTLSITVGGPGAEPERVPAAAVTSSLFPLLRVQPALGRVFAAGEDTPSGPRVAILSYGYWQSRFGGDPNVIGRTVPFTNQVWEIVGVMPKGFAYPASDTKVWVPMRLDPANPGNRKGHSTRAIGRLAPGVDIDTARAELAALMQDWKIRFPDTHTGHYLFIRPMLEDVSGNVRPALLLLLAATGFVLLIVCANVASIVMARGEARIREMAIRGALGAERRRLVRLSLVESAILAVIAGTLGAAFGYAGVRALLAIDPTSMPRASEIGLDLRVAAFTAAASIVSAVLFGLMPALRGARPDLQSTLRESSQSTSGGTGRQLFRRGLVVAEVMLSVVLVLGAGLMLRSFARLVSIDPGFSAEGLLSASISLPQLRYDTPAQVEHFYATVIDRMRSTPGVVAVSAGSTVPLFGGRGIWDFEIDGRPKPAPGQPVWSGAAVVVRPGYFETLRVPIVRGRTLTPQDDANVPAVVVINEALAAKYFAGEDPLGHRIRISGVTTPDSWMTIVGISRNVRADSLDAAPAPAYHFLQAQAPKVEGGPLRTISILARTAGAPDTAITALRAAVRELDPAIAIYAVNTGDALVRRSVARPRFTTTLLTLFAVIGLLLGASGIYSVLAYTVARRTQEIGIRRALGAPPSLVVREVIAGGMKPVLGGLALGLLASYWTTQWWSAQLFGISAADPLVYAAVAAGVLIVALAATIIPVRRALRINPIVALRAE